MNIWILNHYATNQYFDGTGRHQAFGKYLTRMGHDVKIFCANTVHNSDKIVVVCDNGYVEKLGNDGVKYVFVKTRSYEGNGKSRFFNMMDYYRIVRKTMDIYKANKCIPDIIIASSVHPLALLAGIKWGKKNKTPCICEIRDLWPESIVAYSSKLTKKNPIIKVLYKLEKWIYINADALIFTSEGGADYIKEQGWMGKIHRDKVHHICNGVDLEIFTENTKLNKYVDKDLEINNDLKIVYAGAIRLVNNLRMIVEAAEIIQHKGFQHIKFIVFGDGDEKEKLEAYVFKNKIKNVIFKGRVDKKYIPSILQRSDICLLHNTSTILDKYGQSQNKLFEYLASGKCVLQTYTTGYSICRKYGCGIMLDKQSANSLAEKIIILDKNRTIIKKKGQNALKAVKDYDYKVLTDKLLSIIEDVNRIDE